MAGSGGSPQIQPDTQTWLDVRAGYRYQQKTAFGQALGVNGPTVADSPGDTCVPAVKSKRCPAVDQAFVALPQNSPEYQEGSFPQSTALYAKVSKAFHDQVAAGYSIPLQLQTNVLEGYRKTLLHKKWRRCHHLVAMAYNLEPEVRAQDELRQLLLGQQVGNLGTA